MALPKALLPVAGRFAAEPGLGVLSFRVVDPGTGAGARWHVPRLRAGHPERSSVVTTAQACQRRPNG